MTDHVDRFGIRPTDAAASAFMPGLILPPAIDAQQIATTAREIVAGDLAIESVQVPLHPRRQGVVILRGRLLRPSAEVFTGWLQAFKEMGYTPVLRHDPLGESGQVVLHIMAGVPQKTQPKLWINGLLFVLTLISTLFVGLLYSDAASQLASSDLFSPRNWLLGWPFAATLLGILGAHEFGHYFAARYHKVAVSLPFFIPMPLGFGTLGAFIRLNEPVPDQRKLFDIGIAGPLAGLVIAIPLLFLGLAASTVEVPVATSGTILEGNSIFYYSAKYLMFGKTLPNAITGEDVMLNQVAFAAWFGLLVTALNLLPVGQLDGGHTVYALFGRNARYINIATIGFMTISAIAGIEQVQALLPGLEAIGFFGWFVWLGLIIFLIGPFHPPALDDVTQLDPRRRLIGYAVILIFIVTFVPVPMRLLM